MADTHQESSSSGADFDLSQFYQIFFEEAGENLDQMEHMLLNLNLETADDEELNGIFRCAHSVKGGAATFGFSDVAELTHQMESLLDKLRRHELQPNSAMVDVLLESADASRGLLARHQTGEGEAPVTADLVQRIRFLATGGVAVAAAAPASAPLPKEPAVVVQVAPPPQPAPVSVAAAQGLRHLEITVTHIDRPDQADALMELFRDIPALGEIRAVQQAGGSDRVFLVYNTSRAEDLLNLFAFHLSREQVRMVDK